MLFENPAGGFSQPECNWRRTFSNGSPAYTFFSSILAGWGSARAQHLPERVARTLVRSPTSRPRGRSAGATYPSRIHPIRLRNVLAPSWGYLDVDVYRALAALATAVAAALVCLPCCCLADSSRRVLHQVLPRLGRPVHAVLLGFDDRH